MRRVVEIDLRAQGVAVDAGVNDAPLARLRGERRSSLRLPVDWWLLGEGNRLTVRVSPLDDGEATPRLEVAIRDAEERHAPSVTFGWSLPEAGEFEPFEVALPFVPTAVPAVRLWSLAEEVPTLEDRDVLAVRALARALIDAVAARRIDDVVAILEFRVGELAIAVDRSLDWMREATRENLSEILLAMDFSLREVDVEQLRLTPCGDGRVFHVTTVEGFELIAGEADEGELPSGMQVYVSRIEGAWRVVR